MKIVAFAYACEPGKGSEPGAGWGLACALAEFADTWVITRSNNRSAIEKASKNLPNRDRLRFAYVDLPRWSRSWKRGQRGVHLYYLLWMIAAMRQARMLSREIDFDFVWHLTLANAWLGSTCAFVGLPFIYGPVGGGIGIPWRAIRHLGVRGALYEAVRGLARAAGRYLNPLARVAWTRADVILVQNHETRQWLPARHRAKAVILPNTLFTPIDYSALTSDAAPTLHPPTAVFAGRLLPLKGVAVGIRVIGKLLEWRLVVFGSGPDEARLRRLVRKLNVEDRVDFRGWRSRDEIFRFLRDEADVFLFPSLHDEGSFAVAEALSFGLPVVCLDRGGPPVTARGIGASEHADIRISVLSSSLSSVAAYPAAAFTSNASAPTRRPDLRALLPKGLLSPAEGGRDTA